MIKYKIYNFIDKRDLVTWEHSEEGNEGVVGTLVRIDSKDAGGFIKQHMWGGYDYKAGYLNVKEVGRKKLELNALQEFCKTK